MSAFIEARNAELAALCRFILTTEEAAIMHDMRDRQEFDNTPQPLFTRPDDPCDDWSDDEDEDY